MNLAQIYALRYAPVADLEERMWLVSLSEKVNPDGTDGYKSKETMAHEGLMSESTVARRTRSLQKRGLIKKGNQAVAAWIEPGKRPIVWDIQIPFSFYSEVQLAEVNRDRRNRGLGPLTPEMRPDLAPPPERKVRVDKGLKKAAKPVDNPVHPLSTGFKTGVSSRQGWLEDTPGNAKKSDNQAPAGRGVLKTPLSSRPPTLGVREDLEKKQEEPQSYPQGDENQESVGSTEVGSKDWHPTLDVFEQDLFERCMAIRPEKDSGGIALVNGWSPKLLRQVLAHPSIRELDRQLVDAAFILAASDQSTTSPRRLLHLRGCPHWAAARRKLSPAPSTSPPAPRAPSSPPACGVACTGRITLERANSADKVLPCPDCRPEQHRGALEALSLDREIAANRSAAAARTGGALTGHSANRTVSGPTP